jgi:hypothetical protein
VNLQQEEALPDHWHIHMVTGEGEEATGTGGDGGNWAE